MRIIFLNMVIIIMLIRCNGELRNGNNIFSVKSSIGLEYLSNQDSLINDNIRRITNQLFFKFNVNNENHRDFGFGFVEDDHSISIDNVLIVNDKVFFIDLYHANLKRLNLQNGELFFSEKLELDKEYLSSLAFFNGLLYVFTTGNTYFKLDLDLNIIEQISLPDYNFRKEIYKQVSDTLFLLRPVSDVKYIDKLGYELYILSINKQEICSPIRVLTSNYSPDYFYTHIRGKFYEVFKIKDTYILQCNDTKYELISNIPNTWDYYDAQNIDIDYNKIVYFSVNPNEIYITVLQY